MARKKTWAEKNLESAEQIIAMETVRLEVQAILNQQEEKLPPNFILSIQTKTVNGRVKRNVGVGISLSLDA